MKQDIKIKCAAFIDKNNELNQEFAFALPLTKVKMNNISTIEKDIQIYRIRTGSELFHLQSLQKVVEILYN